MIEITSKREGFRRAGIAHSVAPRQYPDAAFTEEQLQQLRAEPMLKVSVVKEVIRPGAGSGEASAPGAVEEENAGVDEKANVNALDEKSRASSPAAYPQGQTKKAKGNAK